MYNMTRMYDKCGLHCNNTYASLLWQLQQSSLEQLYQYVFTLYMWLMCLHCDGLSYLEVDFKQLIDEI